MINAQGPERGSDATGKGDSTLDNMGERTESVGQVVDIATVTDAAVASQGSVSVLTLQSPFSNMSQSTVADAIELVSTPPTSSDGPQSQSQSSQLSQQSQSYGQQQQSFQQPKKPTLETQSPRTPTMRSVEMASSPSTKQLYAHSQQSSPRNQGLTFKGLGLGVSTGGGQKRTASGAIKLTSTSGPVSPMDVVGFGDSRESSMSSVGAHRIGEMSAQLKARLSYALIKVQNGWQSRTLDEVESIYAHQASPVSPPPSTPTLYGDRKPLVSSSSPRVRHKWEKSITQGGAREYSTSFSRADSERGVTSPSSDRHAARINNISNSMNGREATNGTFTAAESSKQQHAPGNSTSSTPSSSVERTYESFWRDHSSNPVTAKIVQARAAVSNTTGGSSALPSLSSPPDHNVNSTSHAPAPRITTLAPPANIIPSRTTTTNPRRTTTHRTAPPPSLPISTLSNLSNSSFLSATTTSSGSTTLVPNTPPQRGTTGATQRDKTAMEQDAVETLMFMSSPGNSQRDPSSSAALGQHLNAPNTGVGNALQSPHFIPPAPLPTSPPLLNGHRKRRRSSAKGALALGPDDPEDLTDGDDEDDDDTIIVLGRPSGAAAGIVGRPGTARGREDDELDRVLDGMGGGVRGGSEVGSDGSLDDL
ncbi:hypothetical protein FGG08_007111 [Glutinoglossum americanum]|uniref:Uncharacterized protein n=1 Tax=Glutinoglossum americanum TaxID=1670608 RepID=A0A9P8HUY1_9PEZI|nr:hypothetical protein FGG08_007111 [Glutinoglossum americanum]